MLEHMPFTMWIVRTWASRRGCLGRLFFLVALLFIGPLWLMFLPIDLLIGYVAGGGGRHAVAIDVETTDYDEEGAEILQVAVVDERMRPIVSSLVRPVVKTKWPSAQRAHGITLRMVAGAPTFDQLLPKIQRAIDRSSMVVIYRYPFIGEFLTRQGVRFTKPILDIELGGMLSYAPDDPASLEALFDARVAMATYLNLVRAMGRKAVASLVRWS